MKKKVLSGKDLCGPAKDEGLSTDLPLKRVIPAPPAPESTEASAKPASNDSRVEVENAVHRIWLEAGHF
jgi:hypothetical protein